MPGMDCQSTVTQWMSLRSFKFNVDWVPIFLKKDSEVGKNTHHREQDRRLICVQRGIEHIRIIHVYGELT